MIVTDSDQVTQMSTRAAPALGLVVTLLILSTFSPSFLEFHFVRVSSAHTVALSASKIISPLGKFQCQHMPLSEGSMWI